MTDSDRPRFAEALYILGETFREPISILRSEGYFDALRDLPIEVVEQGIRAALKACQFFPRPVEIRQLVQGRVEDRAALAWGRLLSEVRRVGYIGTPQLKDVALESTVRALWGTWADLCSTLPGEGPELVGWMKKFSEMYQAVVRRDETWPQLTTGEARSVLAPIVERTRKAFST